MENVGIALWDRGERSGEGVVYSKVNPSFYREHLEYILKEFKYNLPAAEFQVESFYTNKGNHSWSKFKDKDFYNIKNFLYFLLNNHFWALHLRAFGCDISSHHEGHRLWAVEENKLGIDFAFRSGMDAITFHPGSFNENLNKMDPYLPFRADWMESLRSHQKREVALKKSFQELVKRYVENIINYETWLEKYFSENKEVVDSLEWIFKKLKKRHLLPEKEVINLTSWVYDFILNYDVPLAVVRRCKNEKQRAVLSLENVEPHNFLLNLPGQHRKWLSFLREIYLEEANRKKLDSALTEEYMPKMTIDCNHYINSQYILKKNPHLDYIYGVFFEEVFRDFVRLPGDYFDKEPLLNQIIRENEGDILYWHLSGLFNNGEYLLTHEPIKAFRGRVESLYVDGHLTFTYELNRHLSPRESNLEEIVQIIGPEKVFILEIFNTAPENIKNSQENVRSFLGYLKRLRNYATRKIDAVYTGFNKKEKKYRFVEKSRKDGKIGIKEFSFYKFIDSPPYYKEFYLLKDDKEVIKYESENECD